MPILRRRSLRYAERIMVIRMKTCQEAEEYILAIPKFASKHTLEDTRRLLARVKGDHIKGKIIHIAGTNGKGSVCAYLRSILLKSGCSVGMFTSPHLETMRERICLGNEMITPDEFLRVFERVREAVAEEERLLGRESHPTFFEFLFLMAMVYFSEKQPDYLILETGMGGRLDATNCLVHKDLCVITEIGYDHMQYLGNTLEEIAGEKAGIMRRSVPVVFVDKRSESTKVLADHAKKTESPAIIIGKNSILNVNINKKTIDFSLYTGYYKYVSLLLGTTAAYQPENASLAVAACEQLRDKRINESTIRDGLREAKWPGRMEEILRGVYLDGAHNEDGIEMLLATVRNDQCEGKRFLLFGVLADRRYEGMINQIAESALFQEIAVTAIDEKRSLSLEKEREVWEKYGEETGGGIVLSFHEHAEVACRQLLSKKKSKDTVYIAGSLYLIGQMKSFLRRIQE